MQSYRPFSHFLGNQVSYGRNRRNFSVEDSYTSCMFSMGTPMQESKSAVMVENDF